MIDLEFRYTTETEELPIVTTVIGLFGRLVDRAFPGKETSEDNTEDKTDVA